MCVLDSIVLHDTKLPQVFDTRSWSPIKKRYASRNGVYLSRTSSDSWPRRTWYIARMFQIELFRLFTGGSNLSVFLWLAMGLRFNPETERPQAALDNGRQGTALRDYLRNRLRDPLSASIPARRSWSQGSGTRPGPFRSSRFRSS